MNHPPSHLHGSCSCGRNQYTVSLPADIPASEALRVLWDSGSEHPNPPPTPFLRVPLTLYASTTYAFFPDETHASIKRFFYPPLPLPLSSSHSDDDDLPTPVEKHQFCGYCGTPLTYWRESPAEEAEFICLTLGSLGGRGLAVLEDLGVLPSSDGESDEDSEGGLGLGMYGGGWFERMIRGSRLGRKMGKGRVVPRGERKVRVEWEVVEFFAEEEGSLLGGGGGAGVGKRKIGEVDGGGATAPGAGESAEAGAEAGGEDVEMRGH